MSFREVQSVNAPWLTAQVFWCIAGHLCPREMMSSCLRMRTMGWSWDKCRVQCWTTPDTTPPRCPCTSLGMTAQKHLPLLMRCKWHMT